MGSGRLLQRTCLKQHFSLRRQLLTSFGSAAFVTLAIVVFVSIVMLTRAGNLVKERSSSVMREQIHQNMADTTISTAEMYDKFQQNYEGMAQQVAEITMDRIVGYPEPGWEEDLFVPFFDVESGRNVYPLKVDPVPLDWKITPDITNENKAEVIPEREDWFEATKHFVSYLTGSFFVQGICDPAMTTPSWLTYYPDCTDENNNMETGGLVNPTSTAKGLYEKSAELALLFRPIFEANEDLFTIGVHFLNSGAGASVHYPGHYLNGLSEGYESIGCEWLREENPFTGRPLASDEEIARCHPKGAIVPGRNYNAVERSWYRDIVLHGNVTWVGPFKAAGHAFVLMTVGKPIFDRRTGELIGVVSVDIALPDLNKRLASSRLYHHSQWAVMAMEDGRVFTDSLHSTEEVNVTDGRDVHVSWVELGILSNMSFNSINTTFTQLFQSNWTRKSLADAVAATVQECPYGVAAAYPLPLPPREYDPLYTPHFLAVQVIRDEAYSPIDDLENSIDNDVLIVSLVAAGIGLFGMLIILLILWCVARVLTRPLLWMELVSWRIVNHGDKRSGDALHVSAEEEDLVATVECSPRTELTDLVEEFRFMVTGFSGNGASSVAEPDANEVRNTLTWQSDFRQLYSKALVKMKSIRSSITANTPSTEPEDSCSAPEIHEVAEKSPRPAAAAATTVEDSNASRYVSKTVFPAPPKQNIGPVAAALPEDRVGGFQGRKEVYRSRLFCWIVVLIVLPLLLTNTVITYVVTRSIIEVVPAWVDDLGAESMDLALAAAESIVRTKADLLRMVLQEPVRDLLWAARLAGWLHFGSVDRANSFTDLAVAAEQCKVFESQSCPVYQTAQFQCPCCWNDAGVIGSCTSGHNRSESRRLQRRFYEVLAQDFDETTGNRKNATSFNETAFSPETTFWQTSLAKLPGAHKGQSAAGFETTYDRLRVSSALAVVEFPIYNYQNEGGRERQVLGSFIGFEADGLFTGFSGCSQIHTSFSSFVSDQHNRAFEISGDLCPEGKYGFDPRCRNWYSATRDTFNKSRETIHITAPYVFGVGGGVGLSVATPIADPSSGDFVGVMLLDFVQGGLLDAFASLHSTHDSFLITPDEDVYGGDIVVGTDSSKTWSPGLIIDELFPDDGGSSHRTHFLKEVLSKMKAGLPGNGRWHRQLSDGQVDELVTVFSPVNQTIMSPIDPTNLTRGVKAVNKTIYSVAISYFDKEMRRPFEEVEEGMNNDLDRLAIIDGVLALFLSLVFLVIACKITIHVTRPMITLLSTVRSINSKGEKRDIPPLQGGSREVHQVYNSFSKLYKVVRISNTAFFSGNLFWAHHIVNDAIQLFRKINDRKAIGIACNNLGNIVFARILELGKETESSLNYGFGHCATQHYNEAVEISQEAFDRADTTEGKAASARELADRLFNRGLYFIFMEGESDAPENSRARGLDDIAKARDLDYDVKEFYLENKLLLRFSGDCFSRILRRIHGLCTHFADDEIRTIWDPSKLVEEADELLYAAWYEKTAPMFNDVNRVGRLQQLEAAAIRVEGCKGNHAEAARIGMRMFAEDEYLLEGPFSLSAAALLHVAAQSTESDRWSIKTMTSMRSDLRKMTRICRSPTLDLGKCVVFALELNERVECEDIFPSINSKCMNLFENHCTNEDYVGVVSYTVNGDHTLELSPKCENADQQRAVLADATKSTSERVCSALPFAMQIVLDSSVSQEMDTYILLFTDGFSWDSGPYLSIKWQIARMNRENESDVHLIILGVDVEPEHVEECKAMCSVSRGSFFVELAADNIDETFSSISSIFSAGRLYQEFLSTMTMEKF